MWERRDYRRLFYVFIQTSRAWNIILKLDASIHDKDIKNSNFGDKTFFQFKMKANAAEVNKEILKYYNKVNLLRQINGIESGDNFVCFEDYCSKIYTHKWKN